MRTTLIFLLALSTFCYGQNDTINRLHFPYQVGHHMLFNEYKTYYTPDSVKDGVTVVKIIEEEENTFEYYINSFKMDNSDSIVNFHIIITLENDTTAFDSPLFISDEGMIFYLPDELFEYYKKIYKIKARKDIEQQAIKTPLFEGSSWESYDYSLLKTRYTCLNIDTLIETPAGKFNCFMIGTQSAKSELKGANKDFTLETNYKSCYAQGVGKVAEFSTTYMSNEKLGISFLQMTTEVYLQEVWWDEE